MNNIILVLFYFFLGMACIMYGVRMMSSGLEKANLRLMEKVIALFTKNVLSAFIVGAAVTALVQSSAAVTVITVGFVNSGILRLSQAVGIIYGANIGTTITSQLMSLNLTSLAIPILLIGFMVKLFSKKYTTQNLATAATGFGFMFIGIGILNWGIPFIKNSQFVYDLLLHYGKNPYLGLVFGIVITMLVQSSSATVGLTIVLFNSGLISFDAAIGLTLGDNIGTCITAQLASLGTNLSARRTAWAHTLYNVFGVLGVMLLFTPFIALVQFLTTSLGQDKTKLIANAHTLFNLISAMVFLPLTRYYIRLLEWLIPQHKRHPSH